MKFLIWLGCAFLYGLVTVALSSIGIYLGGLPTIALCGPLFFIARALCKAWDAREPRNVASPPVQKNLSDPPSAQPISDSQEDPVATKVRYCRFCGSIIDPTTKKCTGCGKQYFSFAAARRIMLPVLAISLIAAAGFFLYSQYETIIADYQNQIDTLSTALSESKSSLSTVSRERDSLSMQVKRLESDVTELENAAAKTAGELRFYRMYAVIVPDNGSNLYHTYSCPNFAPAAYQFWIYNKEAAESRGYLPCSECID